MASLWLLSNPQAVAIERGFPDPAVSYVLLDARTGSMLASRFEDGAVPAGSLAKPFTALAYGLTHHAQYPVFECKGTHNGCWRPKPHGKLNIRDAVAQSCNAYFLALAREIANDDLRPVVERFGITLPNADTPEARIGLGPAWPIDPLRLLQAYLSLQRAGSEPAVAPLIAGLAQSAASGTGSGAGKGRLAKTGTAPCTHRPRQPGDGFAIVIAPAVMPRYALLVRIDGKPGAAAAVVAGQMLQAIGER